MKKYGNYPLKIGAIIFLLCLSFKVNGLVPVESLILGDFSNRFVEKNKDPLEYIFKKNSSHNSSQKNKEELALYRGFFEEGENLINYCKTNPQVKYSSPWEETQVKRSLVATFQFFGLDITSRSIPAYAKLFEFSEDEFYGLARNLTENYCSKNISIISVKEIRKNLLVKFNSKLKFSNPNIKNNPLFPKSLLKIQGLDKSNEQEFLQTVKLFRSFCSWGGDPKNLRLLVPLLRHPSIYASIVRKLTNLKLVWKPKNNKILLEKDLSTPQVLCDHFICRKTYPERFVRLFPKAVGSRGTKNDLERLYCQHFRNIDYTYLDQEPKVKKIISEMDLKDQILLGSQWISLVTGIPDFLVRADKLADGVDFTRLSMDRSWQEWAEAEVGKLNRDLYFEEPLMIETVDRDLYFNNYFPEFKVIFDLNLGEFDRVNQIVGKVKTSFKISVSHSFLSWVKKSWNVTRKDLKRFRRLVKKRFESEIANQIEKVRVKYPIPPWVRGLDKLVVKELVTQLLAYRGNFFNFSKAGKMVTIPITLNISPFALKYFRHKFLVARNKANYSDEKEVPKKDLKYQDLLNDLGAVTEEEVQEDLIIQEKTEEESALNEEDTSVTEDSSEDLELDLDTEDFSFD